MPSSAVNNILMGRELSNNLRDGINHIQAHLDCVGGVIPGGLRQTGHAVVAVTQDLDTQAPVVLLLEQNNKH